jgi:hypothetical protein
VVPYAFAGSDAGFPKFWRCIPYLPSWSNPLAFLLYKGQILCHPDIASGFNSKIITIYNINNNLENFINFQGELQAVPFIDSINGRVSKLLTFVEKLDIYCMQIFW